MMMNRFFYFLSIYTLLFILKLIKYINFLTYSSLSILILPISYYLFINFMFNKLKILISYSFSNILIFLSLILFICFNNFLGFLPYIFTASSHMGFCFSLSFSLWMSLILFSIINYSNYLLAHLTPLGTPFMLMPFMVIIESISLIIRSFTLAILLAANMIAGYLLLTLLGFSGTNILNPAILLILISI